MKTLKNGWVEGSVQELMDLSDADMEYIEAKMALSYPIGGFKANRQKGNNLCATVEHQKTTMYYGKG